MLKKVYIILKIPGAIISFLGIAWMGFEIYDGWRDARVDDLVFQGQVISYMEHDSLKTNMVIDSIDALSQDLAEYKETVDILAQQHVAEFVEDSTLTRQEFLEKMDGLMDYIDDIKKKPERMVLIGPPESENITAKVN